LFKTIFKVPLPPPPFSRSVEDRGTWQPLGSDRIQCGDVCAKTAGGPEAVKFCGGPTFGCWISQSPVGGPSATSGYHRRPPPPLASPPPTHLLRATSAGSATSSGTTTSAGPLGTNWGPTTSSGTSVAHQCIVTITPHLFRCHLILRATSSVAHLLRCPLPPRHNLRRPPLNLVTSALYKPVHCV
jgi:hypothetical protein